MNSAACGCRRGRTAYAPRPAAPVAPGAADLLVIGFEAAGQIGVEDVATSGLSMPMPKAMVATITTPASVMKRFWLASRASLLMPA